MRPAESFIRQPVRSLQNMLRVIAQSDEKQPSVIPDGLYGNQTIRAVTAFQRNNGLPATGITDQATWDTVVAAYEPALIEAAPAQALEIILSPGEVIGKGSTSPKVYIVQAILQVLSDFYGGVTPPNHSGVLDEATVFSIQTFQEMAGLPETGEVDKTTWKHLALHYPLASNINKRSEGRNY